LKAALMLTDKTIVITGASSGLGASLSVQLSHHKTNLVLFSRNIDKLQRVAKTCNANGSKTLVVPGDISKPEDCKKLYDETINNFNTIDHILLNAGISMWAEFEEITDLSLFQKLVGTNYLGSVYLTHYCLPALIKSKGMITAISSIQGKIAVPNHTGYVASKHALTGFLNTLRMEVKSKGVDIMLVMPHWLRGTNLRKNAFDKDGNQIGESKKEHSKESISLEECSKKIIKGMIGRKRELIIPRKLKVLTLLNLFFPNLAEKIVMGKVEEQK
jgi:short-subunit dehydrogenase